MQKGELRKKWLSLALAHATHFMSNLGLPAIGKRERGFTRAFRTALSESQNIL